MTKPIALSARDSRQTNLLRRLKQANSKEWASSEAIKLLRELTKELTIDPRFKEVEQRSREVQSHRRTTLAPNFRFQFAVWQSAKTDALNKVLEFLSKKTGDRRTAVECGYTIHVAACRYEQQSRRLVTKLKQIKGHVIRQAQPTPTDTHWLKKLQSKLHSSHYVWTKAWAARPPGAIEVFARAHPGKPVPIFAATPSPAEIQPLLDAAIKFAARPTSPSQERRDEVIVALLIAYGITTGKKPTLSRSPRNPTMKFMKSVERAYKDFLPNGFKIPWNSHSKLERLRTRAVKLLASKN